MIIITVKECKMEPFKMKSVEQTVFDNADLRSLIMEQHIKGLLLTKRMKYWEMHRKFKRLDYRKSNAIHANITNIRHIKPGIVTYNFEYDEIIGKYNEKWISSCNDGSEGMLKQEMLPRDSLKPEERELYYADVNTSQCPEQDYSHTMHNNYCKADRDYYVKFMNI